MSGRNNSFYPPVYDDDDYYSSPYNPRKRSRKTKSKMDPVSRVILVVSMIVFLGSGGYLVYKYLGEPLLEQMALSEYKKDYQSKDTSGADNGVWNNDVQEEEKEEERLKDGTLASFKAIRELNKDVVGWITVPNTMVDYPVVQSKDNVYYLKHNINKEYNDSGCPFLDFRNSIKPDSFSRSIIIYGHHRRNGTMFAHLKNYNEVEFYKNNPVLRFDTIYERSEWIVFSNFRTTTSWSTGVPFDYLKTSFKTDDEFLTFVNEIKKRSLLNMPVDVRADDKILLLSTCSYEKSNWRMIIAARRIRDGESSIDVSSATKAANPVMP